MYIGNIVDTMGTICSKTKKNWFFSTLLLCIAVIELRAKNEHVRNENKNFRNGEWRALRVMVKNR